MNFAVTCFGNIFLLTVEIEDLDAVWKQTAWIVRSLCFSEWDDHGRICVFHYGM